jgi:hypothetical protein
MDCLMTSKQCNTSLLPFLALLGAALLPSAAVAETPFTADTLGLYLNNEVNGLELNHLFIQSMLEHDAVPLTFGAGARAAPARYLMTDGTVLKAGLGKMLYTGSWGIGSPAKGTAGFLGFVWSRVRPSGFPNIVAFSGSSETQVLASGDSMTPFVGISHKGFVGELAYHYAHREWDADSAGRFMPGGCHKVYGCDPDLQRAGSPRPAAPTHETISHGNVLLNFEHVDGHYLGVLVNKAPTTDASGATTDSWKLAAVRAHVELTGVLGETVGALAVGLNRYGKDLDYYGDRLAAVTQAAERGETFVSHAKDIYEVPVPVSNLFELPVGVRGIVQAYPYPTIRMLEAWAYSSWPGQKKIAAFRVKPLSGVRARGFRRGTKYVPSCDVFLGGIVDWKEDDGDKSTWKGVSLNLSYAYNSPDSLTFVPLPDTHVVGIQLVYGNPTALPVPVKID